MSRGPGKVQRALLALFKDERINRLNAFDMAKEIYKTPKPTKAQMSAINRALLSLEKPLVALGWDLSRGSITKRDDQWCPNQRLATGRVNVLTHTARFHTAIKVQMGNRPISQYIKDEMPDGEKFIEKLEKDSDYEVRMEILMEVNRILKVAPIKLRHLERLKHTLLDMHDQDQGKEARFGMLNPPGKVSQGSSAYERAVARSKSEKSS